MNPTRYQKQLQWKIENEKRALELKKQKENQLIEECTFTPKIHTTNSMYHQRERPREENYSNENHVLYNSDFQNKKSQQARKEKKDVDNR